ncbi:MAG: hypothetical protein ACREQ5_11850 [Candidatus Dormibacteria bacterium]
MENERSKSTYQGNAMNNLLGFGDAETWPSYSGHPNDPRNTAWEPNNVQFEDAFNLLLEGCEGMNKIRKFIAYLDSNDSTTDYFDRLLFVKNRYTAFEIAEEIKKRFADFYAEEIHNLAYKIMEKKEKENYIDSFED